MIPKPSTQLRSGLAADANSASFAYAGREGSLRRQVTFPAVKVCAWAMVMFCADARISAGADDSPIEELALPPLRIAGVAAQAHTQGLELVGEDFFVTARRDDVQPRRALLLRTRPGAAGWSVWDVTPQASRALEAADKLDHPGGMQFDGKRLWIPVAESRRGGRTVIMAIAPAGLHPGQPVNPEVEFIVEDHIGALAVSPTRDELWGASWDTEDVYIWKRTGELRRKLSLRELQTFGLGFSSGHQERSGLTVQDWKIRDDRLHACGLFKPASGAAAAPRTRLLTIDRFWEAAAPVHSVMLSLHDGVELGREGMAVSDEFIYFLPEDLGPENRLLRTRWKDLPLTERSKGQTD